MSFGMGSSTWVAFEPRRGYEHNEKLWDILKDSLQLPWVRNRRAPAPKWVEGALRRSTPTSRRGSTLEHNLPTILSSTDKVLLGNAIPRQDCHPCFHKDYEPFNGIEWERRSLTLDRLGAVLGGWLALAHVLGKLGHLGFHFLASLKLYNGARRNGHIAFGAIGVTSYPCFP